MANISYVQRTVDTAAQRRLEEAGIGRLVARLLAARGVNDAAEVDEDLGQMLKPTDLKGAVEAGELLAQAIVAGKRITVVADYDCDGASACAVMLRGLAMLGAETGTVSFIVPDRQRDGYGLTPVIVDRAIEQHQPDVLVTVDNGIASFAGVQHAVDKGLQIVVTDHHLPAVLDNEVRLPNATVLVNPSQPGCRFASKALCGAGVAFYVMLMTRAALRATGRFDAQTQPRMDALLDLVALATVADVVRLDANNRRLVAQGVARMRAGRCHPGIRALFEVSGRKLRAATSTDLGFGLGPRINAAGRLADMTIGIGCLLEDDPQKALALASQLHQINQERRSKEAEMSEQADATVAELRELGHDAALVVHDESFHEGVVGIVAGRIKEREHKPTFVFARAHSGELKGSGRSIPGFHLRDALDLVSKRHPDLIVKFGGHAMAAGCTLRGDGLEPFREALGAVAREWLTAEMLERKVFTDGELPNGDYNVRAVQEINARVWGQGFEAPLFVDEVRVAEQRVVGEKHMKLTLEVQGQRREGIWFRRAEPVPERAQLAYRVAVDEWNGKQRVQMVVEDMVAELAAVASTPSRTRSQRHSTPPGPRFWHNQPQTATSDF